MTAFRKPRLTCPHCGSVFVIEKPGDWKAYAESETSEPTAGPRLIELRKEEWFQNFWAYYLAGNLAQCRKMITLGKSTEFWPFDPADAPSLDAVQAMPKVKIDSDEWTAWRKRLAEDDLRMSDQMVPVYVWVPSEWPQQDLKTARAL